MVAVNLWDDESWHELSSRHVNLARAAGALTELPVALELQAAALVNHGELAAARALLDEADAITDATGSVPLTDAGLLLAGWQGEEAQALEHIDVVSSDAAARGEETTVTLAGYAAAVLYNGLGRHDAALAAGERALAHHPSGGYPKALVEIVEAGARGGQPDAAARSLDRLREATTPAGSDWALGIEARSLALVSDRPEALYIEAIERLGGTRVRPELARAHLLYGEWLRRERRRLDARTHLRTAHELFTAIGARAFADRAARELLATGETARKRREETRSELTAQEAQVARLARDGLSNPEIGARLFISPRTVQYHLHKVFAKLEIRSRAELELTLDR